MNELQQMVFIGDLKGNLQSLKAKKDDVLIVTFSPENYSWPTQESIERLTEFIKLAFKEENIIQNVILIPDLYKVELLTEEYKQHLINLLKSVNIV